MSKKISAETLDELFGFVKVKCEDETYGVKFTLGSLIQLKNIGINIMAQDEAELEKVLSDPEMLAKTIYYGMPFEMQEKIPFDEFARKVPLSDFEQNKDIIKKAIKDALPESNESKDDSDSGKKKLNSGN